VDLNHNYDAGFLSYKELERERGIAPGPTRYAGDCPLSEPETHALASFIKYDSALQMILTLHTAGEEIYYSDGGRDKERVERIARKLSALSGYKLSRPEGLSAYGGLTDWYIKEFSRPSFTVECGKEGKTQNEKDYFNVYASIREMLLWAPLLI
jgi:g-D-glutamyl-meso-diaminopimelate peptidase